MGNLAERQTQALFKQLRKEHEDIHFVSVNAINATAAVVQAQKTKKEHYVVTIKGQSGGAAGGAVTKVVYTNLKRWVLATILNDAGVVNMPSNIRMAQGISQKLLFTGAEDFAVPDKESTDE